ncbi:MAG: hypothetical protein RL339_2875 [Pseudomonadota bacterium]
MRGSTFGFRNSKKLTRLLLCSASGLAVLATPQLAYAQAAPADEDTAEDVIIVTARKQDETLQEVPVTITSVGADTLEKYSVDEVSDVTSRIPTLNIQVGGSGSGGQISLRGVGSSNISASFDSAVAFDYDGVQVSTMRMVQSAFFDTAQIDVLKGPQSLYFGKSASAGVFSIKSLGPTSSWEVGGKASYEFEERGYTVGGFISGPLTDSLGIRVAGQYNKIDRFVEMQPGTPAVNQFRGLSNFVGRVTLDFKPDDVFSANLKVQYNRQTNDGAISHSDLYCGANGRADVVALFGGAISIPAGYDCNYTDNKIFLPDTAVALARSVPLATGPTKARGYNGVPFGETDLWFARLKMDWKLADNLTLSSVTGFVNLDAVDVDNYSYGGVGKAYITALGGPGPVSDAIIASNFPALSATNTVGAPFGVGTSDPRNALKQLSQELRLASDNDGMFNFMIGGFYEWRRFIFDTAQNAVNISLIAPDPITGYTWDYDKNHTTKTEATSVFGSVMIDLTEKLELSGGVRYTNENKTQRITVPYVHRLLGPGPAFIGSGFVSPNIDFKDDNLSPEVTLKYQATPDINVFASYKTGFKSGGVDNSALPSNSLSTAALTGNFNSLIYKSEDAKGGEIGVKSQFADRSITLNATAYYYKFTDLQVQVFNAVAVQFVTSNAGEVTTKGVDVGWAWRTPVEGLRFSGNLAYLDAYFSSNYITFKGVNLNGRKAARAPKWSGNTAFDYSVPINDSMQFSINGNAQFSSRYYTNTTSFADYTQDKYWLFDASVSIGDPDGKWKLSLIGSNLTNKLHVSSSGDRPFLPVGGDDIIVSTNRGRQVYVEASFKF